MIRPPPISTLFPYPPFFRSRHALSAPAVARDDDRATREQHVRGAHDPDRKSTRLNSSHIPLSRMPSFFLNDPPPTDIYPLSLPAVLPLSTRPFRTCRSPRRRPCDPRAARSWRARSRSEEHTSELQSHSFISYAVFFFK